MGDGYSIAWRVLDAQFWGVPQRRKRIYLVADFDGHSAGEILFKPDSVPWDLAKGCEAWEEAAGCAEGGAGAPGCIAVDYHPNDSRAELAKNGTIQTLTGRMGTGGNNVPLVLIPPVIPVHDKATRHEGGGDTRNGDGAGNGLGVGSPGDPAYTLTAGDRHMVTYCLDKASYNQGENSSFGIGVAEEVAFTLTTGWQPPAVAYPGISGTVSAKWHKGFGGPSGNECQNLVLELPRYIVRRITPFECGRLQGFPDGWTEGLAIKDPEEETVDLWEKIFEEHRAVTGTPKKPRKRAWVRRWLANPKSDAALYKMWGNGIALPCAVYVLRGIIHELEGEETTP